MKNITVGKILLTLAIIIGGFQLAAAQQKVTSYPYTESFEENSSDWTLAVGGDDFNWARSQSTRSAKATEGQHFMHITAASSVNLHKKTALQSRTFDLTSLNKPNLVFAFHILGPPGILQIEASTDGTTWNKVWSTDGKSSDGSGWSTSMSGHGDVWKMAVVNLSAHKSGNTQLRFVGGTTTSIWGNYIAIDAITVTEEGAPAITGVTLKSGLPGSPVTVNGVALDRSAEIKFNGVTVPFHSSHPYIDYAYIYANLYVPAGATTGKITATVNGQTATSMTDFQVPSAVNTFPYNEDFESGDAGSWKANAGNEWHRREGWHGEPYWSTKPNRPSVGYSYMTLIGDKGKKYSLVSPLVDARSLKNLTVTFDYHMGIYLYYTDSSSPNILTLEVSKDGGTTWAEIWRKEHTHQEGNPYDKWTTASANLRSDNSAQMLFRFSGTRSNSWNNDISIDNVTIKEGPELGYPVADFKVNATEIWEGESLKYNNESQNAVSYLWQISGIGSDFTTTEKHPTIKYDTPGSYHTILIAYNSLGESSAKTMAITVKARPKIPVAEFKVSTSTIWEGESLKFNNESQYASRYEWRFEGGDIATSTDTHPIVKYDTPGSHLVMLIAYNDHNQTAVKYMRITVKDRATARTTASSTSTATVDVKIYSNTGALLKTTKIAENDAPAKSLRGLQNGLYFVHVVTKQGVKKHQIVKQD